MNFLRQLLLQNFTLKIISLLLAFLLWLQIAGQQTVQRPVAVPIEFANKPTDLVITNEYPKTVNVLISKPSSVRMNENDLAAIIDLSSVTPGNVSVPLTEGSIRNLPSGVRIESIEERAIRLQLERTRRKMVSVLPEIIGTPEEGFEMGAIQIRPSEVLISGPESRIDRIASAKAAPIDVSGRRSSFSQKVYVDLEDPSLRIEGAASVDVFLIIEEKRREIKLTRIPVRTDSEGGRIKISPGSVEVIVTVPVSFTEELDKTGFAAVVSTPVQGPALGEFEATPTITVPQAYEEVVRIKSVTPRVVKVTLR